LARRVAIITEIIAPYRIPVFNALAQREGIDLHVVFLSENDPGLRQWRVYKTEIGFAYEVLPYWRRRFGRYHVLMNRGVTGALGRIKPDVVLCGGYNYLASWMAAGWARSHKVPLLLWSESTVSDQRRGYRLVEFVKKRFLSRCQAFVVPGKSSFHYLQDLAIQGQNIYVAPNAVDVQLFSQIADEARDNKSEVQARHNLPSRYFLYVGRLVRAKGVFELLDAYAQLDRKIRGEMGLVFVGDGESRNALMRRAAKISPGILQFFGFMHREQLPQIYALADALIFPTHSDTWGLVVNEAMSCGLAVIASSVAGCVADLVTDGWNGFVVQPGQPDGLASAMARLAVDSQYRTQMGSRSRARVQAYSPAAWAEGMVQAVESVCARAA
jgi:glycosyltransferase involved in cell wall biosynthesis